VSQRCALHSSSYRIALVTLAIFVLSVQRFAPASVPKPRPERVAAAHSQAAHSALVPALDAAFQRSTGCTVVVFAPYAFEDARNGTHAAYAWSHRNSEQAAADAATSALIEETAPPRSRRRTDPDNVFVLGSSCTAPHGAVAGGRKDRVPSGYWAYGTGFGNSISEAELNAVSACNQTRLTHNWENIMGPCSVVNSW